MRLFNFSKAISVKGETIELSPIGDGSVVSASMSSDGARSASVKARLKRYRLPILYVFLIILIVLCALGGITLAMLTDSRTIVNTFTIGEVAIELHEPAWDAAVRHTTYPGRAFAKDPQITNTGENDAAVFLEVLIPRAAVRTYSDDAPQYLIDAEEIELFTFTANDAHWLLINGDDDVETITEGGKTYSRYVYGYSTEIVPNETTVPLFYSVVFANVVEGELQMDTPINILIRAYAVQHMQADLESGTEYEVILFQLRTAFALFEVQEGGES